MKTSAKSFYIIKKENDYHEGVENVEMVERTEVRVIDVILNNFSKPKDKILDPFMGMGTILKKGELIGRECYGIENNKSRYEYVLTQINNKNNIFNINANDIKNINLPLFDLCFTAPPFCFKNDAGNALRNYEQESDFYSVYLEDLTNIYEAIKPILKKNSYVIIDTSNVLCRRVNTTLAWDIKMKLDTIFEFQYEIVFCWEDESFQDGNEFFYQHSYCLVFKNV